MKWCGALFTTVWFLFFASANACMVKVSGINKYLTYSSDIIVQRDLPIGTVIRSDDIYLNITSSYASCDAGDVEPQYVRWVNGWISNNNIAQTNIPGIGMRVGFSYGGGIWGYVPTTRSMTNPTYRDWEFGPQAKWQVELIKTGPVYPGRLASGRYASLSLLGLDVVSLNITGANIIPVACSITTPTLTFPIGNIWVAKFGSTVGTIPAGSQTTQNLGLACDTSANINVSLAGTQSPDVANSSVLALTNQGSAGVASGVGVQLLYNGTPLSINNRIVLKRSAGGQETFPLTAQYYQTKNTVTTGTANTSATLNITYQ